MITFSVKLWCDICLKNLGHVSDVSPDRKTTLDDIRWAMDQHIKLAHSDTPNPTEEIANG